MTDSVVVEGYARLRDGKKWKTRWLVLRKPSPVADCLVLLVFKDKLEKAQGNKERANVTLEEICGLEAGQWYEGVAFTLAILCLNQAALLGFDTKEALQAWDARLRYSLGEVHRFSVGVLPGTKLESGPATLHLCNNLLALAREVPPVIIGHWNLPDLRRYGPVPNGFVFEGGTRCGYWAGVFLLASAESEQISFLFDCIVRGISPTRGPFGLQPVFPDPNVSQMNSEEKLNLEAQELEKRLSLLSHESNTVLSTYCLSAGGDNRSISGSSDTSDTSQSDCSSGSRLAIWTEPASNPPENVSHMGSKVAQQIVEKLSASHAGGNRPAAKPPRQLQEIGRQSSSDSGIATGSHSSYSGSFSSYTGSLDITPGEDFGSVFSLPPHLAQDLSPCICLTVPGHEYQVPTSLRYLYDTPRSLVQEGSVGGKDNEPSTATKDTPSGFSTEAANRDKSGATTTECHLETTERRSTSVQLQCPSEEGKKNKVAPSSDSYHLCSSLTSSPKTIVTICSVCGGFKGTPCIPSSSSVTPAIPTDQSVDKPPCSPSESWVTPGSGRIHGIETPTVETSQKSPIPQKRREKLASLLADLLGFSSTDRQPDANTHRLYLYESMRPAFGNELYLAPAVPLPDSLQEKRTVIYENCLKCQGERCHPPPRVMPAEMYCNKDISPLQTFQTPLHLKKSPEHKGATDEELLYHGQSDGSQSVDGQLQYEEMNGRTVINEDKRFNSKEERRRADPAYEIMESRVPERNSEAEEKSKYELMGSCSQQRFLQESEEAPLPERPWSESVTYVNIPVSPTSKKQLNYMELELQEPGHGTRGTAAHQPAQIKAVKSAVRTEIHFTLRTGVMFVWMLSSLVQAKFCFFNLIGIICLLQQVIPSITD
ncbi:protein Dok-7-like isoform X3 [Amphiprion ocellaris]|uniref:protein Dok-7-like isoform X3 n=1 Tax=Amphiprion ocellaris TaxID=80972 RepID=UPI002411811F|nr:protein Dok-7-like isoform X3 [Amphiprion ocellaris]